MIVRARTFAFSESRCFCICSWSIIEPAIDIYEFIHHCPSTGQATQASLFARVSLAAAMSDKVVTLAGPMPRPNLNRNEAEYSRPVCDRFGSSLSPGPVTSHSFVGIWTPRIIWASFLMHPPFSTCGHRRNLLGETTFRCYLVRVKSRGREAQPDHIDEVEVMII